MSLGRILANIISWVFLPFVVPVYGLLVTLFFPNEAIDITQSNLYELHPNLKMSVLNVFIIFSVVAPGISYFSLKRRGIISSLHMDIQKERSFPILIMMAYCLVMFTLFLLKDPNRLLPFYIVSLPLSGALLAVIVLLVNLRMKVSLHAAGMGILVGYLMAFNAQQVYAGPWFLLAAFVLSGIVGSARIFLHKHTLKEVIFGWIIAVIIAFCTNYFYADVFKIIR